MEQIKGIKRTGTLYVTTIILTKNIQITFFFLNLLLIKIGNQGRIPPGHEGRFLACFLTLSNWLDTPAARDLCLSNDWTEHPRTS